jgi:tetratricopeptide (TPR) repeat protein
MFLPMPSPDLWTRLKQARIVRVVAFYLGACWVVLQVVDILQDALSLPDWLAPVSVVLLLVGGVVMVATALVQASPHTDVREEAGEVPGAWQVAPKQLGRSLTAGQLPHPTWGRSLLGGIMAFWFVFGLAGLYVLIRDRGETFPPVEAVAEVAGTGVAVMPFRVQGSEDLDLWREGMVDLFSTNLDGVGGFRTIDSRTVLARWGERIGDREDPDLGQILGVASEAGAIYALVGSAVGLGSNVRLTADLYEVDGGTEVGQAQVEGSVDDVLALVDQLSVDVMRVLLEGAGAELPPVQHTASITTSSLPALRAYLESETYYRSADFPSAIEALERAVQADSTFALAYYRLSDAYGWVENIGSEQGQAYMRRARELADRLPPRYVALLDGAVGLLEGDLTVVPRLESAVTRYPDDPEMWFLLGEMYVHYAGPLFRSLDELDRVFSRAVELDPTFVPYYLHLIEVAIAQKDQERTDRLLQRYREMVGDTDERVYLTMGRDLAFGDSATVAMVHAALDTTQALGPLWGQISVWGMGTQHAARVAQAMATQRPGPESLANLGWSHLFNGRIAEFELLLEDETYPRNVRAYQAYIGNIVAGAVSTEALDRFVSLDSCGDATHRPSDCAWAVGSYAADTGRWDDHALVLRESREAVDQLFAAGDSAHALNHAHVGATLEGYGLWLRGRRDEGMELVRSAQGHGFGNDAMYRFVLGRMYHEMGQLRQAARYYESFWQDVNRWWFALQLGDVYAELGDTDRARGYYALFLEDWAAADPDRPEVARARAAIAQLGG